MPAPPHLVSAAAAWERILRDMHPDQAWIVGVRGHDWQAGAVDAEPVVEPPVKPPPAPKRRRRPSATVAPPEAKSMPGPSLQGRVLEAVSYRPGSVDELAKYLDAPASDVVAACDLLRGEGEIVAQDDGRWRAT